MGVMKVKIAVEFEIDIEEYTDHKMEVARSKIINAVQLKHKHIIPTGEWCFMTDEEKEYANGVFYSEY